MYNTVLNACVVKRMVKEILKLNPLTWGSGPLCKDANFTPVLVPCSEVNALSYSPAEPLPHPPSPPYPHI